jgi:hypothetical protein
MRRRVLVQGLVVVALLAQLVAGAMSCLDSAGDCNLTASCPRPDAGDASDDGAGGGS